jgi:HSP20 family protein
LTGFFEWLLEGYGSQGGKQMIGYFSDFERTFSTVDQLRRRMEHVFGGADPAVFATDTSWPRTSVYDAGDALVLVADLPGVKDTDIDLTLEQDQLTLAGERKVQAPEGHTVHRQERRGARFSRTFNLPFKVDANALTADLKDGVLTVRLPKAPEAQARKITVKAG